MKSDSVVREAVLTSVDTKYPLIYKGADTPGAFKVPSGAKTLTEIIIGFGTIGSDVITGTTSGIHLSGDGITIKHGWFLGGMTALAGAAAKDGGFVHGKLMRYRTNIPVEAGGEIECDGFMWGEDPGLGHLLVQLMFDTVPGRIVDGDLREESLVTANTMVSLRNRGDKASGDFKPRGKTIGEIVFGGISDPVGDAAAGLLIAPFLHLKGTGLKHQGNYEYLGGCGTQHPDTDISGDADQILPERFIVNVPTSKVGEIEAEAMNIESTISIHAVVGLLYIN